MKKGISRRRFFQVLGAGAVSCSSLDVLSFSRPLSAAEFSGKFSLNVTPVFVNAPLLVALDKGYYSAEGLDPEAQLGFINPANAIQLMTGGKIDVACTNPSGATNNSILKGAPLVAIAAAAHVPKDKPNTALMVSDKLWNQGVKTLADLKGQTINLFPSFDSTSGLAVNLLLKKGGLQPKDVRLKGWRNFGALMQAMQGGAIDVGYVLEPIPTILRMKGKVHSLGSSTEVLPGGVALLLWANRNWLKKNEETCVRFLKGYLRGVKYFNDAYASGFKKNTDVLDSLLKLTKTKPELTKMVNHSYFPPDGKINRQSLQRFMEFLFDLGKIEKIAPIEGYVNETYLEAAYRRLKKEGKI